MNLSSDFTQQDAEAATAPPPMLIGALLRIPFETVRDRMLAGLHERGYTDLVAAHLDVFQYPGPENQRPIELATQTRMSKQALNYLLPTRATRIPDPRPRPQRPALQADPPHTQRTHRGQGDPRNRQRRRSQMAGAARAPRVRRTTRTARQATADHGSPRPPRRTPISIHQPERINPAGLMQPSCTQASPQATPESLPRENRRPAPLEPRVFEATPPNVSLARQARTRSTLNLQRLDKRSPAGSLDLSLLIQDIRISPDNSR
jgi:hypothetical protein